MTTLNQLTYDLLNTIRGGVLSDDESIGFLQVQFWIKNTRAMLIRQDINKGRTISGNITQILPCLDVIIVDASNCPCKTPVGCTILRTRDRIPKPLEVDNKDLIMKVSSIKIGSKPFSFINISRAPFTGYSKFGQQNPKAFYSDGYIWIINSEPIEKISVYGVFEDPTDLAQYVDCSNAPCWSDDDEYPISAWMIPTMQKLIIENNFKIMAATQTDVSGNAKSDTEPSSSPQQR